ncbi:PrsW family intramembrane metalloprotease [Clostridium sp. C2-6-12]|uniref:PrsW family glutamic-type intramembrane protease n=1 Tax=Clostridium sp. C2-6-12 TaxID=2698832 RepID=UPI00136E78B4|nr:PrsW family intramembrane metalloprotease [Clostridium sp. C2-6-12]
MTPNIKFCPNCGEKVFDDSEFCNMCGLKIDNIIINTNESEISKKEIRSEEDNNSVCSSCSDKSKDNNGQTKLRLLDLVVNVFKKHTLEERENTFICGTLQTAPKASEICSKWPKPWLYSRIFILFTFTFIALVTLLRVFRNVLAFPGIIFIGAFIIPFTLLIFFWEVNAPRNVNIFDVVKIFFIGGVSSLLITMVLSRIVIIGEIDYYGAFMVGFIEETGKLIVVAYYLRGSKRKYILNGLLVGAAVGAGFAVFETAGYVFAYGYEIPVMMKIIYMRGALAFGGHIVWAAMCGASLAMVKEDDRLRIKHITNLEFFKYYIIAVILHAVWDMPISNISEFPYSQGILTIIAWVTILILIRAGLNQVSRLKVV